jgi:hypothetical protein
MRQIRGHRESHQKINKKGDIRAQTLGQVEQTSDFGQTLPEKLDWIAASKFILDAAIRFKLRRTPPSESLTDSNSAARAFGHQV